MIMFPLNNANLVFITNGIKKNEYHYFDIHFFLWYI